MTHRRHLGAASLLLVTACNGTTNPLDARPTGDGGGTDGVTLHDTSVDTTVTPVDGAMPIDATPPVDVQPPNGCATPQPRPAVITVDQAMGVNGFFNNPAMRLEAFGAIREYHDWQWDEGNGSASYPGYPHEQNEFDPAYPDPSWNFDGFYRSMQGHAMVSPAIQGGAPGWLTPSGADIPVPMGADTHVPASYVAHADHMFQYAARYGSTAVADALLKLAAGQPRLTGSNLLSYFEDGNEPNAWWVSNPNQTFTATQYAAMASADYDGDCGSMGTTVGVRNADPHARMVMAGLSSANTNDIDLTYLSAIQSWADVHRHGSLPADVINVHHYCGQSNTGTSPEADHLDTRLAALTAWRDAHAPGREIWLSEIGWDTNIHTSQAVHAIGTLSTTTVQGAWILRAYLVSLAAGIDRVFLYMLADVDESSTTQYSSSGVLWHGNGLPPGVRDNDPKPSWFYVSTMRSTLTGMVFHSEIPSGNPNVRVLSFRSTTSAHGAYAVWATTSNDTRVAHFALPVGSATMATGVALSDTSATGTQTPLAISGGHASLDVSEVPQFVLVDSVP